jgi:hypothetical protein
MMRKQEPPAKSWGVWIGHYVRKTWLPYWGSSPFVILPDDVARKRANQSATYYNSQVSTQVVGQLYIQVIRTPPPDFVRVWKFSPPNRGDLYRIWPPVGHASIVWPGRTMTDLDADYTIAAVRDFLMEIGEKQFRA